MADQIAFYEQQAENCRQSATRASLENERQKFLQAQAAWQALAEKTAHIRTAAAKRQRLS